MSLYSSQAHRRAKSTLASLFQPQCSNQARVDEELLGLSILLLNRDSPDFMATLLAQLHEVSDAFKADCIPFEILVGDTGSRDSRTLEIYSRYTGDNCKIIDIGPYHFSANNNTLAKRFSKYSTILLLNNDVEFPSPGLISRMFRLQKENKVLAQGSQLLYPNGKVQHGGVGFFRQERGIGAYHLRHLQAPVWLTEPQAVPALTGALLMLNRKDFLSVGGFETAYTDECQDIDLCLKLQRLGHQLLLHSSDPVIHHENGTREKGEENWTDRSIFNRRWTSFLEVRPDLLPT